MREHQEWGCQPNSNKHTICRSSPEVTTAVLYIPMKFYINCSRGIMVLRTLADLRNNLATSGSAGQNSSSSTKQAHIYVLCALQVTSLTSWISHQHHVLFSLQHRNSRLCINSRSHLAGSKHNISYQKALYKVAMTTVESYHVERVKYYQLFHHLHLTGKGRSFLDTPTTQNEGLEMKPRNDLKC